MPIPVTFEQRVKATARELIKPSRNLQRYALLELLRQNSTWREGIVPARFLAGRNPTGVGRALCRLGLAKEYSTLCKGFKLTGLGKAVAETLEARTW